MAGLGEEQLWQRQVEHPDGVLHQDILFVVVAAFHSAAVPAVADWASVVGICLVAVCAGVSGFAIGLHLLAFSGQSETRRDEEVEFFLSAYHLLCAPSVVWLGKFGGDIEVTVYETIVVDMECGCC